MAHLYLELAATSARGGRARGTHGGARAMRCSRASVGRPDASAARRRAVRGAERRARHRRSVRAIARDVPLPCVSRRSARHRRRRRVDSADDDVRRDARRDYPDAIVQIAHARRLRRDRATSSSRRRRDWDFRARYEPIPHVSSHGALHREHMLVPLLMNRPVAGTPRRTTDLFAERARRAWGGGAGGAGRRSFL